MFRADRTRFDRVPLIGVVLVLVSLVGGCRSTEPAVEQPADQSADANYEARVDRPVGLPQDGIPPTHAESISRIAFGSCARESDPQPIWDTILGLHPDVFVLTGDNIYGDTDDMSVMRAKYDSLAAKPGFAALRASVPILATWDDHDYGRNDAGSEYEYRNDSQAEFLRFFGVPASSHRWKQPGIYHAETFGPRGRRTQIITLDTRYFRSTLETWPEGERQTVGPYMPTADESKTVLGDRQWEWLEARLVEPADLRIIVTSIQAIPGEHGFETWANFPHERRRLFKLIERTRATGVVLISGDRHLAEMSVLPANDPDGAGYPIYEVTSSALVRPSAARTLEPNRYRVHQQNFRPINFGVISVDWEATRPLVSLQIRDYAGVVVLEQEVRLDELVPR